MGLGGKGNRSHNDRSDTAQCCSAIASLIFSRGETGALTTTKSGAFIFSGEAARDHEWEVRAKILLMPPADKRLEQVPKIIEGLRGDAYIVAEQLGIDTLSEPDGVRASIAAMNKMVFPYVESEAKELFRHFTKPAGVLTRQTGESMASYIGRRQRSWVLLRKLMMISYSAKGTWLICFLIIQD